MMTFSQRAVEAAAKALYISMDSFDLGVNVDSLTQEEHMHLAICALTAALAVDGAALVPRNATDKMICAALDDYDERARRHHSQSYSHTWSAMLSAASDGEERK